VTTVAEKRWFAAVADTERCDLCRGPGPLQVAHRDFGKGMGLKTQPCETAALCVPCHRELTDGTQYNRDQKRAFMDRAIVNAHLRMAGNGRLKVS
jgi:hypothetical protein